MITAGNVIDAIQTQPDQTSRITMSLDKSCPSERCFTINDDALSPIERRSFATNVLLSLAALHNKWSTYDNLATIYNMYKPDNLRKTNINIRENVGDWNRKVRNEGFGNIHEDSESSELADGCKINKPHRVCRKDTQSGVSLFRIHPEFAEEVFTPSDLSVEELLKKRGEKHNRKRSMDSEDLLRKQQKRGLKSLKTKMTELKKLKQSLREYGIDIDYNLKIKFKPTKELSSPTSPSATDSATLTSKSIIGKVE